MRSSWMIPTGPKSSDECVFMRHREEGLEMEVEVGAMQPQPRSANG